MTPADNTERNMVTKREQRQPEGTATLMAKAGTGKPQDANTGEPAEP